MKVDMVKWGRDDGEGEGGGSTRVGGESNGDGDGDGKWARKLGTNAVQDDGERGTADCGWDVNERVAVTSTLIGG